MKYSIIFMVAALAVFSSCCFSDTAEVIITVPNVSGAKTARLTWIDSDCVEQNQTFTLPENGASLVFTKTVAKNFSTPFLLEFYTEENTWPCAPYGLLYPHTAEFNAKDGFACEVLRLLYSCSEEDASSTREYLSRFDWSRFIESCRAYDDPWLLDRELILNAIASGTFKKSDLKLRAE